MHWSDRKNTCQGTSPRLAFSPPYTRAEGSKGLVANLPQTGSREFGVDRDVAAIVGDDDGVSVGQLFGQ